MKQKYLNLRGMTTLLVDNDHFTRSLIAQMLKDFETGPTVLLDSGAGAKDHLLNQCPDLCIFEAALPDMESAELIRWIRHRSDKPVRFVPIMVLSSYTQSGSVARARDAGANLVLRKPVPPLVLFEHIAMVAKISRSFIEASEYTGPDRRFRAIGPTGGNMQRDSDQGDVDDAAAFEQINTTAPVAQRVTGA